MTLHYVATRQRDRYRVFDGRTFLGVVERPRFGKRGWAQLPYWINSVSREIVHVPEIGWVRRWSFMAEEPQCHVYDTRSEAAEALRQMRRQEAA